jgi:glyoxylate reductase
MPKLHFVQQPSVGYQHIDLAACRRRGVLVANTPGVNSAAVAEHTIMVALAMLRRLVLANELTHAGRWSQHELMWEHGVFELAGKTFGIVGLGSVGREVARRLSPFGVQALYFDPVRAAAEVERELGVTYKLLDHLLRLSDVVSLHVPLTDETRNLIGERQLGLMKFNAVLINVARGECVDELALAERLRAKKLGGAAVDVFSQEPISPQHPLLGLPNALLTPHLAGATNEVRERVVHMAVGNLVRVLKGEAPQFVLNTG